MLPERFQVSRSYDENGDPNRIYFHISVSEKGDFGHVSIRPCWLRTRENKDTGEVYSTIEYHGDYVHCNETHLNWFQITAQYNLRERDNDYSAKKREPYAVHVGYNDVSFDLEEIEKAELRMKFLKWLGNRVSKFEEKYGRIHDDLGKMVNVIAAEFGIEGFVTDCLEDAGKWFGKRPAFVTPGNIEKFVNEVCEKGTVYF